MDWKCYVESYAIQSDGIVGINVVFVNEVLGIKVPKQVRTSAATLEGIKAALRAETERLEVLDVVKEIPLGVLDLTPSPPVVDSAAVARAAFNAAAQTFRLTRTQFQDGFATQKQVDFALSEAQKLWLPEYAGKSD
jgi:hypothetical protein